VLDLVLSKREDEVQAQFAALAKEIAEKASEYRIGIRADMEDYDELAHSLADFLKKSDVS